MKLKKGKWMALTVAVLMGMSAFTSVSADEGQTDTTFIKGELNGIPGITFSNDFAKYNVWNAAKGGYVFTKDSLIKTNEGIFAEKKSVKIMAKGVTLTMIPQQFKNKHGEHGNLGGIQINVDREYKAREGTHLPAKDVSPDIGIDIEVGKFIIDIDPNKNAAIKREGLYYDTYGIASVSRGGNKVNIKGDVDVTVKNGYRTKRGFSFTGGITTMHQGHINIDGNAKVTVDVENGHNLAHYLVNGIFAGLNYTPDKYGSDINITGNVDVKSNGTGIQATGSSFLTIGGGGTVTIDKKTQHYSLLAEEGFISMNVKLNRLSEGRTDEMPKVESVGSAVTKIYGDVKFNNHESRGTTNSGLAPSIINLALTTSDSRLEGVVIDDFKEEPTADSKKQWARSLSGLNLYLQNGAVWKNEMWGNHQSSFTGSKVRSIIGGDDIKKAGIIEQNDSNDITVKSFEKHIKVIYQQGKDNPNFFKGGAIRIKSAKENSSITLRANLRDFKMPGQGESNVYDAALNALAGKLYYEGKDGHLTGKVEVAEGLMAEAWSKDISFKADGQGEYKAQKSEKPSGPVVPSVEPGSNPIPSEPSTGKPTIQDKGDHYLIKGKTNGESIGFELRANKDVTWEKTVKVDVEGVGNNGILTHNRVIGINVLFASVLTANGDVVVSVKNSKPAISGEHFRGRDLAHYYMSGIYVGNEMAEEEPYDHDPAMLIKGKVDLDVVGVALQATKHGIIKALGGGKIVTHKLDESASYAMLAEESRIYMNTGEDGQNPGTNNVDIKGNIAILNKDYGHEPNEGKRDSIISVGLTTKDSKLEGGILNEFEEKGDNPKDSGIDLYLQNGATWENGWLWTHRPEVSSRPEGSNPKDYLYKGSKVRNLIGGESEEKAGIIYQNEDKDITIKNLSGHVKVIYKQNAANDKAFDGGAIRIKKAKENSRIILRANIKDFQMPQDREVVNYDDVLNTLAGKLFYEAQDGYLTGRVEVAEGLMTDALGGDIAFKAGGQGELKAGTISKQTPSHSGTTPGQTPGQGGTTPGQTPGQGGTIPGQTPGQGGTTPGQDPNFETSVMKGIRSTMVSTGMISTGAFWSAQNNDVERRMGDIRLAQTETGLWAKYQGGSSEYNDTDSRKKAVHVDQTYNAIQVGYDKSVGDWIVGGTFSYGTTKDKYIDNRDTGKLNGTGKETGVSGGVYGTLKQKDGSYLDVIAKVGQIKNNYEVYTKDWDKDKKNDDKVNSEYKVNGTSLSVEYGKRIEREGFYVEPSMELTVNRVAGHSEEVTSEVHKERMKITQDDMTSVVGRIGVGIGQNYENGHIYGKLSLAHEFNGDIMTTFSAGNKEEVVKLSLRGTWLDVEMGGSYRLSKDSYFYGSFTKNFGAKLNNKWRLDAGIRLAF